MIKAIRAKLHGIRVTGADLDYHGSVTLDPEVCDLAGIYPLEFVDIWNKHSGARISTYVIFGEAGSRCCVLNGAAARTCQKGDELIIGAASYCDPADLYALRPKVLTFLPDNQVDQRLEYDVFHGAAREFDFRIVDAGTDVEDECHTYRNVDVNAVRADLKAKGLDDDAVDAFVRTHLER